MLRETQDEEVEIECPECGALVRATAEKALEGILRCPRGHEIEVMGMLGDTRSDSKSNPRR
jgi:hypothetical protein